MRRARRMRLLPALQMLRTLAGRLPWVHGSTQILSVGIWVARQCHRKVNAARFFFSGAPRAVHAKHGGRGWGPAVRVASPAPAPRRSKKVARRCRFPKTRFVVSMPGRCAQAGKLVTLGQDWQASIARPCYEFVGELTHEPVAAARGTRLRVKGPPASEPGSLSVRLYPSGWQLPGGRAVADAAKS